MSAFSDKERRAESRANWPGIKTTLADAPGAEDLSTTTTIEERLGMMWELSLTTWLMSGKPIPDYSRAQLPTNMLRPKEP